MLDVISSDEILLLFSYKTSTTGITPSVEPTSQIRNGMLMYWLHYIYDIPIVLGPKNLYILPCVGMVLIIMFIIILLIICLIVRKRNKQSLTQNQGMSN